MQNGWKMNIIIKNKNLELETSESSNQMKGNAIFYCNLLFVIDFSGSHFDYYSLTSKT